MRGIILTIALIPLILCGCTIGTSPRGHDFISSAVPRIEKGSTPASQILHWFGEPYEKKPLSESETIWLYAWSRPAADPTVVPFGHRNVGNTGYKKTLWLLIRDDVVVNYAYEEGII